MGKKDNAVIRVNELTKRFGDITAVNSITFDVNRGEIFGFLGPNGAGKTTTIRMLTGLITQDSGDVFIDGVDMRNNPIKAKKRMGIIPELGNIYMDLTAEENIVLSGRFYGIPKRELEKRADRLLNRLGLSDRRHDQVRTFSTGMKQSVNIASVIVHDPEILFLDEPTSGLDVQSQRLIRTIIKEMNQGGTTIFLTTHNIEEANILCDRVGIINKGNIAAIDTPKNLKKTFEETQSVEFSFDKRIYDSPFDNIEFVSHVERLKDRFKLYTDNPDRLVKYLSRFAEDRTLLFTSMEICKASLEDVFIKLTESKRL
jgi:ABC-2 type transport system ATP-binding protein